MTRMARALVCILAMTVAVAVAQTVKRAFSVDFSVAHDTVEIGAPIVIRVRLKNTSDHVIYRMGLPGWDVHGELVGFPPIVRDAQGKEPPLTKWGRLAFGQETPEDKSTLVLNEVLRVPMSPGEVMKTEIKLSDLYDLSAPGKYTVQVRYYDDENKEELKSDPIAVKVVR
jgi:hypothetical protein